VLYTTSENSVAENKITAYTIATMMSPLLPLIFLTLSLIVCCADLCSNTAFSIEPKTEILYDVRPLKEHLPPSQSYSDKANLYAVTKDSKSFIFFNLMDLVHKQKIDDSHKISDNCQPRSTASEYWTNLASACVPESNPENCLNGAKHCWRVVGACHQVNISYIDDKEPDTGIRLHFFGGSVSPDGSPDSKQETPQTLQVDIECCKSGTCLQVSPGLLSPLPLQLKGDSSSCSDADYCVTMQSPYGCTCDQRVKIDESIGKKEFICGHKPQGLHKGLSTGTWILLIFSAILILYLGIGIGYNYSEGLRGTEMLPHLEMWKDMWGLVHDGFRYVISCGEYRAGVSYDPIIG